ncbi:MAG: hypothetical protein FIB01_01080 [Gemmatimonadetes bacterium]|nr:hypothetical protein [Gemmatimonadota bacterium]
MRTLTCEQVRELLPEHLAESPDSSVAQHLATCFECRAEAKLLAAVQGAVPRVPAGLEAKVLQRVRLRPGPRAWLGTRQLALAATLAAAVIGGSVLLRSLGPGQHRPTDPPSAPATRAGALPVLEDPAVYGGSVLSNLTDTELESLLTRMES